MIWRDHWWFLEDHWKCRWFWRDYWKFSMVFGALSPLNVFWRSDHCHQWFFNGFWSCYHRSQWFSMVLDHWSNDAMVSMDGCGLMGFTTSPISQLSYLISQSVSQGNWSHPAHCNIWSWPWSLILSSDISQAFLLLINFPGFLLLINQIVFMEDFHGHQSRSWHGVTQKSQYWKRPNQHGFTMWTLHASLQSLILILTLGPLIRYWTKLPNTDPRPTRAQMN